MDDKFTTKRVLKAWWAMQWRAVVATFVGAMVLIMIFAFFAALLGVKKEFITIGGNIIYTFVAIFASIYFFGFALKKDYGTFRFEIIESDESDECVGKNGESSSENRAGSTPHFENSEKERE